MVLSPSESSSSLHKNGVRNWFDNKIVDPLLQILRRGAEPKQLAFSASLGITLGIFPICGIPVFLCGIVIALLGSLCHAPSVMLFNVIATPIELSLVVPFLRFGEVITGGSHFPLTSDALKKVLTGQASRDVLLSIAHALLGWLVAAPFILVILYIILLPCSKLLVRKFSAVPNSPKKPLLSQTELKLKGSQRERALIGHTVVRRLKSYLTVQISNSQKYSGDSAEVSSYGISYQASRNSQVSKNGAPYFFHPSMKKNIRHFRVI